MISFPTILRPDGNCLVQQQLTHPAVYLDTWAVRLFAEHDPGLGDRFRKALLRAEGTLVLSHINVGEFTFDEPRHAHHAGQYIAGIGPQLFFSMFDPFRVITAEIPVMVRQTSDCPAGDLEMLREYAEAVAQYGVSPIPAWFDYMYADRMNIAKVRTEMAESFCDGFKALRRKFESQPGFAKSALCDIKNSTRPRSTQALLRAVMYRLQGDRTLQLKVNDALDLYHCIVPGAYCDFVLLDRAWYARVNEAHAWLAELGIMSRVANAVTRRGVEDFLDTLEARPSRAEKFGAAQSTAEAGL